MARKRFESGLRAITGERGEIARLMEFSMNHADAADEVSSKANADRSHALKRSYSTGMRRHLSEFGSGVHSRATQDGAFPFDFGYLA